jgi:hypothetical protein
LLDRGHTKLSWPIRRRLTGADSGAGIRPSCPRLYWWQENAFHGDALVRVAVQRRGVDAHE